MFSVPLLIPFWWENHKKQADKNPLQMLSRNTSSRGPVQDFPPFDFFLAGTIFFEASPNQNKNRQTSNKERDNFWQLTWSIVLANYCMLINHILQLHQCQLPLIHNFATVRSCQITFNMPWPSRFDAFFAAGAVLSKNLACMHNLCPGNQLATQQLQ